MPALLLANVAKWFQAPTSAYEMIALECSSNTNLTPKNKQVNRISTTRELCQITSHHRTIHHTVTEWSMGGDIPNRARGYLPPSHCRQWGGAS